MLVFSFILFCPAVWAQGESDSLEFLTPNRREMIHIFTSFFTPYSDMQDLVLRASEYGFPPYLRRVKTIPDSFVFNFHNMTNVLPTEINMQQFFKCLVDTCKSATGRKNSDDIIRKKATKETTKLIVTDPRTFRSSTLFEASMRPRNYLNYINAKKFRIWRYIIYPLNGLPDDSRKKLFHLHYVSSYKYSTETVQHLPIGVLAMNGWRIFFWMALSQLPSLYNNIPGAPKALGFDKLMISVPERLDELSSTFLFHLCAEIRLEKSTFLTTDLPNGLCPNPCATSPCLTIQHTTGPHCHLTGLGLFMNDFRCECKSGYLWVSNTKLDEGVVDENELKMPLSDEIGSCGKIDACASYCDQLGTTRCEKLDGTTSVFCLCKVNFMGPTCGLPRNPCIELSETENMPGNMACNTGQGGICMPAIGSDFYECQCGRLWTKSMKFKFENCLALKDRCSSEVCVRGDCLSSEDGSKTICLCPEEAYGKRCEHLRDNWAQWTAWSACIPVCGHGQLRRRERVRSCLGPEGTCRGGAGARQIEACPVNLPCPDELVILGQGSEALAPQNPALGGVARPNTILQQTLAFKKRKSRLLVEFLKLIFLILALFTMTSASCIVIYALFY